MPSERMQEGLYRGRPISVFAGSLDNDKGTEYFAIRFEVQQIYEAGEWQDIVEQNRDVRFWVTEKSAQFTTEKLEGLGLDVDALCDRLTGALEEKGRMLIGDGDARFDSRCYRPGVELRCTYRHTDGGTYENWDLARGGGGMGAGEVSRKTLGLLKKHASAKKKASGSSADQKRQPAGAAAQSEDTGAEEGSEAGFDVSDDDIPF